MIGTKINLLAEEDVKMSGAAVLVEPVSPLTQLKLAREIAADMRELDQILELLVISQAQWEMLQRNSRFQEILRSSMEEWQSVTNTPERVKMKSLAFVEEALPEFYARVHDAKESLSAKNEVLKTVSRLAGVGGPVEGALTGERMIITINLGADQQLEFVKQSQPALDLEQGEYQDISNDDVTLESNEQSNEQSEEELTNSLEGIDLGVNEDELGGGYEGEPQ